jgi:hypothetical protein
MSVNNHDIQYTLLQRHSAEHVEISFSGTLLKQPVFWHAHIHTLSNYCIPALKSAGHVQAQSFIDIQINNGIHQLTVALNLPEIDEAAILRTIIMIRQYKRLLPGRHLYGDMATIVSTKTE